MTKSDTRVLASINIRNDDIYKNTSKNLLLEKISAAITLQLEITLSATLRQCSMKLYMVNHPDGEVTQNNEVFLGNTGVSLFYNRIKGR